MPVKSKAQWRKLHALAARGELSKEKLEEFKRGVNYEKLPARKKRKGKKRRLAKKLKQERSARKKSCKK